MKVKCSIELGIVGISIPPSIQSKVDNNVLWIFIIIQIEVLSPKFQKGKVSNTNNNNKNSNSNNNNNDNMEVKQNIITIICTFYAINIAVLSNWRVVDGVFVSTFRSEPHVCRFKVCPVGHRCVASPGQEFVDCVCDHRFVYLIYRH